MRHWNAKFKPQFIHLQKKAQQQQHRDLFIDLDMQKLQNSFQAIAEFNVTAINDQKLQQKQQKRFERIQEVNI